MSCPGVRWILLCIAAAHAQHRRDVPVPLAVLPGRPGARPRADVNVVTQYNAGWRDYLVTGGRLHFAWWSHVFYEGRTALFPGVTAIVLAAIAIVSRPRVSAIPGREWRWRSARSGWRCRSAPRCPDTPSLHQTLPLRRRAPKRRAMGMAGAGGGRDSRGFRRRRPEKLAPRRRWIAVALGALVTIEAHSHAGRLHALRRHAARSTTGWPAKRSPILAEFPFYSGASVSLNGPYVLANTRYFRPLMNGYSSFHPDIVRSARPRARTVFRASVALAELQGCQGHARHRARESVRAAIRRCRPQGDRQRCRSRAGGRGRRNQALSPEMTCRAMASAPRARRDSRASRRSASCSVSSRFEKQKRTVCGAADGSI